VDSEKNQLCINNILQKCIYDQINAALKSIRDSFQKISLTLNFQTIMSFMTSTELNQIKSVTVNT